MVNEDELTKHADDDSRYEKSEIRKDLSKVGLVSDG